MGQLIFPKEDSARPFVKKWKGGSNEDLDMASVNFGIKAGNSVAYVELFGMRTDTIYTMGTDNKKLEVPWDERLDPDMVKSVADYKKITLNIAGERKDFISPYDAILYMEEYLKAFSGTVKVRGTMEKEPYISNAGEKRFQDRFIIESIWPAAEDKDKPSLVIDMDFYYNKKMVDKSDFKSDKRITVDGYVHQYLKKTKSISKATDDAGQEVYLPQRAVLMATDSILKDETRKAGFMDKVEELTATGEKKLYHCRWGCVLISGGETIEFDESQLTKKQKRQIELGESTLDDFRPKGNIIGPRIYELRLVKPLLTGDFDNGTIEAEDTLKEFQEAIMQFKEPEDFEEIAEAATSDKEEDPPFDIDDALSLDDLEAELGEDYFNE